METIFTISIIVGAVIFANILYAIYPKIPLAFYQIAAGLLLSLLPLYHHYQLNPEIFLYAIITPLMFNDAQNTSRRRLRRGIANVLSLSIFLVVITVIILGFSINSLFPLMTLPLAFAIGAIVTPTDAVAVKSITSNMALPNRIMNTLENESLFNDASGIVALNLSLSAYREGSFSVGHGISSFIISFFGGLILGAILGLLIVRLRIWLREIAADSIPISVPLQILTPFIIYFVAEQFEVSGILAVVAAGLVHGAERDRLQLTSTKTQFATASIWTIISDMLNGFVFVLLGLTLPTVVLDLISAHTLQFFSLFALALLIYAIATGLRFLWVYAGFVKLPYRDLNRPTVSAIMATSGIHGTVTLSMALSIPFSLANGKPFPMRNEIIFVAAVVILLSLIVPNFVIPLLVPAKVKAAKEAPVNIRAIRNDMLDFAITELQQTVSGTQSSQIVLETLYNQKSDYTRPSYETLTRLFKKTQHIEQTTVQQLVTTGDITPKQQLSYERFLIQSNFATKKSIWQILWRRIKSGFKYLTFGFLKKRRMAQLRRNLTDQQRKKIKDTRQIFTRIEERGYNAVIEYLNNETTAENFAAIGIVRRSYRERHRRFSNSDETNDTQKDLFITAFQYEYDYVDNHLNDQLISIDTAKQLREQISYDEIVYMQNSDNFD
ncbi:cation:proton antiporter [Loigolactobacillus iwatensis]|uniref:cation:proton antiporter n=1 Tax=Loigolactobacillus iwatensis TaxID=1267156 RepID=UPI000F7FA62A|nr:sodium:proton antiporter [Loigolactobacillus iwatensis]